MDGVYNGTSLGRLDIWSNLERFYNILIDKDIMNDEVLDLFLNKYDSKTKYYFGYLSCKEDKFKAIEISKEFLSLIRGDNERIRNFTDKYLCELISLV